MRNFHRTKLLCRLFVWGFRSIREFFTHLKTSTLPINGANIDLIYSQLRFSSVSHVRVHGHLQRPVTRAPVSELLY